MKKVLFSAALLMAAATVSFAGNPKGETKSETKTETTAGVTSYWFYIDGSGNPIPQTSAPSLNTKESTGCPDESSVECARGYSSYTTNGSGQYVPSGTLIETAFAEQQ